MVTRFFFATLTLLLCALLAAPQVAEAGKQVPYKDNIVATFDPTGLGDGILEFEVTGTATHLGRFTGAGFVDLTTGTGQNLLTAANGDQLFIDIVEAVVDESAGTISVRTVFTGGTGRFQNATGGFSGSGTIDFEAGVFRGRGEGTISSPGKAKGPK